MFCPFDESVLGRVTYGCACGMQQPLARLYFCRHCLATRCSFCVSHEVDSHYCPNCLENMPSAEARLKRNRCANCFDCPSCGHTLSTKATSVQVPSTTETDKMVPKKAYYLSCAFCRWTSRDVGLPDQSVASGGWPDVENPSAARLANLQENYRTMAQKEKLYKESKRYIGHKLSYMSLSEKYGISSAKARRRAGLPSLPSFGTSGAEVIEDKKTEVEQVVAKDISEVEELPEDIFEHEVDLCSVTTLTQRLSQVEFQPEIVKNLYPRHKHLMIKRSQRCRKCEHNLCKPEYNPSSIKFKIQLAAYYHVPEIVIFSVGRVQSGEVCEFILKVVNPTQHPTKIEFVPESAYEPYLEEKKKREETANTDDRKKLNILRTPSLVRASDLHKVEANATFVLPSSNVFLPPRDDTAEFDDAGPDMQGIVDDKNLVVWRRSNKAGVKVHAKVAADLKPGQNIITKFGLRFIYTNTISALEQREIQKADIIVPINVILGKI